MSPIAGLTDGNPSFHEIGRIRKGGPKQKKTDKSGGVYEVMGKDLDHFRITFRDDIDPATVARFTDRYGDEPTLINVRLAFQNIKTAWDAWYVSYLKGGLLGRAGDFRGDGINRWNYLRDYRSNEVLIRDGKLTPLGVERKIGIDFDPEKPVYFYKSRKNSEDVPVYATPEGRLSVVVPELGIMAYLTLITHSLGDIAAISSNLEAIRQKSEDLGIAITQIPLVLTRRRERISMPTDNGRVYGDKWMVHLEVAPEFAEIALQYMDRLASKVFAMSPGAQPKPPALSSGGNWPDDPENIDNEGEADQAEMDEITSGPAYNMTTSSTDAPLNGSVITDPTAEKEQDAAAKRPFNPATTKTRLLAIAENHAQFTPSEAQKKLLIYGLKLCFIGEDDKAITDKRHIILNYLTGHASSKEVDGKTFKAIVENWLHMTQDSGGDYFIDPLAAREAQAIVNASLVAEGQASFLPAQ